MGENLQAEPIIDLQDCLNIITSVNIILTKKHYKIFMELLKAGNIRKESIHCSKSKNLWANITDLLKQYKGDCPWIIYSYVHAKAVEKIKQTKYLLI
jgi:hypothetical protein